MAKKKAKKKAAKKAAPSSSPANPPASPPVPTDDNNALRRQIERLRREIGDLKDGRELVLEAVNHIYSNNPERFHFDVPVAPKTARKGTPEEIAVLHLSDVHIGKRALDVRTPIPTPDGWVTMGDLRDGDLVFDDLGQPARVVKAHPVLHGQTCYRVRFNTGDEIIADAGHLWAVSRNTPHVRGEEIMTTQEIHDRLRKYRQTIRVRVAGPLECVERELPIPPYVLGAWLGDGHSASSRIGIHKDDRQIFDEIRGEGVVLDHRPIPGQDSMIYGSMAFDWQGRECKRGHDSAAHRNRHGACRVCASNSSMRAHGQMVAELPLKRPSFAQMLAELGARDNKRIPLLYLRAGVDQRLALLQGLMDTDGHCNKQGFAEITLKATQLVDDLFELVVSLGMKPRMAAKEVDGRVYQRVTFKPTLPVFRLERKAMRLSGAPTGHSQSAKAKLRRIVAVEPVESVPVRCITVDSPSRLFLAGRAMIPTHNTKSFDSTVAAERMRFLTEKVFQITDLRRNSASIDEIRVYLGGDIIEGENIFPGQSHEIDSNLFEQALINAPEIFVSLVSNLLKKFHKVRICAVPGNHGRCHSSDTELLTREGWKKHEQLRVGELVATYQTETGQAEWQPLLEIHRYDFDGDLLGVKNRNHSFAVTPNHRMLTEGYLGQPVFMEMQDIAGVNNDFPIPICSKKNDRPDFDILDDEIRLAAWVMTDGSIRRREKKGKVHTSVLIFQSKVNRVDEIRGILERLAVSYTEVSRHRGLSEIKPIKGVSVVSTLPQTTFHILASSRQRVLDLVDSKVRLPEWVWQLSNRQFQLFLETLIAGDGSTWKEGKSRNLWGVSEFLDQVQALCLVNGVSARVCSHKRGYCLSIRQGSRMVIGKKNVEKIPYKGVVWCGTVANGTLVTRKDGCPLVSGNSGGKHSGAAKKTNWDRVFYAVLRTNLLGSPQFPRADLAGRLEFDEADAFYLVDRVYDWGNLLFHGDNIKGGFAGFPWYGACLTTEHEILTGRGWKKHGELVIGESVLVFDHQTGENRWEPLEDINIFSFDGELMAIRRPGGHEVLFTDNHRWPVIDEQGNRKMVVGSDLNTSHWIPLQGEFHGEESVLSPRHAAILGWVVTDGTARWVGNHWEAGVYQSPKKYLADVESLLGRPGRQSRADGKDDVQFVPLQLEDSREIGRHFKSKEDLPRIVGRLSRAAAEAMLDAMMKAGGTRGRDVFAQKAGPVADAFQMLTVLTGRTAWRCSHGDDCYRFHLRKSQRIRPTWGAGIQREAYRGNVWCPTTPSGTWWVRHKGMVLPTGNSKKMWGFIDLIDRPWDYAWIGHFHTPAMMTLNHRILLANGAFESDNMYAMEQLAAGGFPCQRLCFFNASHGLISDHPLWLTDRRYPHFARERVR